MTARDITEHKATMQELEYRLSFEKILGDVARFFAGVGVSDFNKALDNLLELIGTFVSVDRCYVYMFYNHVMDKTHEWCKKGIPSYFKKSKNIDIKKWTWFNKIMKNGETIYFNDLHHMPARALNEKKYWQCRGVRSLLIVPIRFSDKPIGFIGFDSTSETKNWKEADIQLLQVTAEMIAQVWGREAAIAKQAEGMLELKEALVGLVKSLGLIIEKRDTYTAGHQQRVSLLAVLIAEEVGLDQDAIQGVRLGALIHDVGKNSIPSDILNRPGRLTEQEFELIKTHPKGGYDIIENIKFPWPVAKMVLQHHERLDGSGYPSQLKNEDIILEARILAVADVVEAICSHRPYRPALGLDAAVKEIVDNTGNYYDPKVVAACLKIIKSKRLPFTVHKNHS